MATLYPVNGVPMEIAPHYGRFTRGELEQLLGGSILYHRNTRQVAVDCFEPHGQLFVLRADVIMILPRNQTVKQAMGFSHWGPAIAMDLAEIHEDLPWFLLGKIWRRSESD